MRKKLAIIGRGTAGSFAATHFHKWTDWDIDWYHDPAVKPQSVGEGLTPLVSTRLFENIGFEHSDLDKVDGSFKFSIFKSNWSTKTFHHTFVPPNIALHVNAVKLQNFIIDRLKISSRINIIEKNILHSGIDSDFIFDCSGFPNNYNEFDLSENIPVNSVYVTQCYWDLPRFNYTLSVARPHGWFFGIPLKNRCSIGYMYNNNYSSVEDIKEDSKKIFEEYGLTPSNDINNFSFRSFSRKQNFCGRVAYNGNNSFFLEPLEATSINMMDHVQRLAWDHWITNKPLEEINFSYKERISQTEDLIMMHYFAGSVFRNDFWEMAKQKGEICMKKALTSPLFYDRVFNGNKFDAREQHETWTSHSFRQNFDGLELYDKLRKLA